MMRSIALMITSAVLLTSTSGFAQTASGSPLIDYDGYTKLADDVRAYRAGRLVSLDDFNDRLDKRDVLLLDARSARAFEEGHIKGAVNLPLPDFTADALAEIIGANKDREILIYCNNNFTDNKRPVATKSLQLALNIQTFINLYGYGYTNIFELGEAVKTTDNGVNWMATAPVA